MEIASVAPETVFWGSFVHQLGHSNKSKQVLVGNVGTNTSSFGSRPHGIFQLQRDLCKGSTDTPHTAMQQTTATVELDCVGSAKTRLMATYDTENQQKQNPEPFRVGSMSEPPSPRTSAWRIKRKNPKPVISIKNSKRCA
ncbi:MAG TPA: hypothetical protein VNK44_03835 [Candidatus Nitrosotenuis sp.]|nr:hypothetical protein [Candidatus Nitrosotenuis sp.]